METNLGPLFEAAFRTETGAGIVTMRLFAAALLGALLGLDREWRDKPAGLKTHMLVSLGAAVFAILALELFYDVLRTDSNAQPDPVRVVEAVVKGAAFLGAGAIIQSRGGVQGLTTGASVWMAGAIGLAVGIGYLGIGVAATAMAIGVLVVIHILEKKALHPLRRKHGPADDGDDGGDDDGTGRSGPAL